MLVAKVVSHKDLERDVIMALEDFGLFEFIDVRHQAGLAEVKKTRDEETVSLALDRLSNIASSLGLNVDRRRGDPIEIDDHALPGVLKKAVDLIASVEPEILEVDKSLATAEMDLERQRAINDVALSVKPLQLDLGYLGTTEYTYTTAGVVPKNNLQKLEWAVKEVTEEAYLFRHVPSRRNVEVVTVTVSVDRKDAVDRIFTALGFETFHLPEAQAGPPETIAKQAEEKITQLEAEIRRLTARKKLVAKEWGPRILAAWESLLLERQRIDMKRYIVYTTQAMKVWGWIPEGKQERLEKMLRERVGAPFELTFEHPDFAEHDSPTYLDNPSFMAPAEAVLNAYGTPSRHDIDPTKIMFFSFPLIFGLVFADVGQGFLILLIGLAARHATRKGRDLGPMLGYLQTGATGIIMMGLFAMLGGFLFGSFFGSETVIEPLWPIFAHATATGERNPFRDAHMLKLSIEVGVIQITIGILLNLYNRLKHKEYRDAVVAASYVWMYLSFANLLFGVSYNSIGPWFSMTDSVYLWIPIAGIGHGIGNNGIYPQLPISPFMLFVSSLIVPLILMLVASLKGGMDGIVYFIEYAIGTISHTVSYARIFALNTVHIVLSAIFFTLLAGIDYPLVFPPLNILGVEIIPHEVVTVDYTGVPQLPLIGAILGTLVVGTLEGLLAFMHTLRLHFVEWFSKFYHAGGTAFVPFRAKRLHTVRSSVAATPVSTIANV